MMKSMIMNRKSRISGPLLQCLYGHAGLRPISTRSHDYDEQRAQELNQKVADIVTNGTGYVFVHFLLLSHDDYPSRCHYPLNSY